MIKFNSILTNVLVIFNCVFLTVPENSLFVDSSERKYLKNLPVTYEGFGKTVCDSIFDNSLNMYVKFYTALDFSFNNHRYYLPMVDSIKCVKFQDKHFGDTLFVNMVLLDATSCDSNCLFIDGNCAYITQISDKKKQDNLQQRF